MSTDHHIDHATVLRYASGGLDEAFTVVVASHLAMCTACRQEVRMAEEIGGDFLDVMGGCEMSSGAFDRLMERLDADTEPISFNRSMVANDEGDVPLPLRRFVGASLADIHWKTVAPGVRRFQAMLGVPAVQLVRRRGTSRSFGKGATRVLVTTASAWLSRLL